MLKKPWIILISVLMYGGCLALFISFIFNLGRIPIIVSIGVILLSFLLSYWKLRCPHCKKTTVPLKGMWVGMKTGKCECAACGEEIYIK
ncbi:MAG: hypothetical protein E7517_02165 [Ruminococcaceae bacterium]|nr:hypothetical protein [Oscillospiraceae bacterium]